MKPDPRIVLFRLIALLELLGGVWGLYRLAALVQRNPWSAALVVVASLFTLIFLLFITAGVLLWRGRPLGLWLSLAVQALQLPHIISGPFGFFFASPASVAVGLSGDFAPQISALWHPGMGFAIDSEVELTWIGVNLLALAAILILVRLRRRPAAAPSRG